ncbi:MAG: DinB family protein [Vicinamibacterales bacterium]
MPTAVAPAWPARLTSDLLASDRRAREIAGGLTFAQLTWKPRPDAWSVGQCLQHLRIATDVYLPPIALALEGRPHAPVHEITPGWFARWFIRSYVAASDQQKKAPAPRKIDPGPHVAPDVLEAFLRSNETARRAIERAAPYDVNGIRFVNPFVPLLRFTVGTGLEIIARHEDRHLLQAERVRAQPGFPAA